MADGGANREPNGGANGPWDEARIEQAMEQLKVLHVKARMLRDTIPRMLEPLAKTHQSPDAIYGAFMKAVTDGRAEVAEFTELMRADASKQALAEAARSRQQDPIGIKPWRHKDHPDWFKLEEKK
ncbi:hypothetical protein B0I35DRAFT_442888 [Stachybotrys elegans]|uniref:Uncharacterized protein n=1 Tax=Stachybotrys elegans TaxID=80388 RepID=A0A8K0WLJ2_9HYPO|nr:hypothetical protein B0I35DRAFT_442888 [Stachybotrys elegans]